MVDWPSLRRPLASALAFASVISMGDLGAIALFGNQDLTNLTLLLYGQLGAYRLDGAASTGTAIAGPDLGDLCIDRTWSRRT